MNIKISIKTEKGIQKAEIEVDDNLLHSYSKLFTQPELEIKQSLYISLELRPFIERMLFNFNNGL